MGLTKGDLKILVEKHDCVHFSRDNVAYICSFCGCKQPDAERVFRCIRDVRFGRAAGSTRAVI